jgi:UDP-glucose 4-epimerase
MTDKPKKIIVTGGAGFIGSNLVDALVGEGYEVHVIDNLIEGKKENVHPKAILHVVDIREKEKLIPIFEGAECIFHEAALPRVQYSIENPIETNDVNVTGLLNVLEAARINKVKRVIFASSCAVYGSQEKLPINEEMSPSPLSPYAAHKYIGEIYLKLYAEIYGMETVALRYFNVYGKRQSAHGSYPLVIAKFMDLRKQGKPLQVVGDGENTRDYVNVKDIVRANLLAMRSEKVGKGEVINIGAMNQCSVNKIAELIGGPVEHLPPRVEPNKIEADVRKAKELLDWGPTVNIAEGIEELKK